MLGEMMAMGMGRGGGQSPRDPAEAVREAILRGKLDRLDPNTVREFIAAYMVPIAGVVQKALLEDPESVHALEGRSAPIDAAYLQRLTDEALEDSDLALDVIGHAILASDNEDSTYMGWLAERARAVTFLASSKAKFLFLAKEFVQREKHGAGETVWFWNFLEIGAISREERTFTLRSFAEAGRAARDYLRRQLGGPRRSVDGQTSVTVDL